MCTVYASLKSLSPVCHIPDNRSLHLRNTKLTFARGRSHEDTLSIVKVQVILYIAFLPVQKFFGMEVRNIRG